MAIRESQDVSLGALRVNGNLRDSQDLSLAAVKVTANLRDSQDVVLVLARARISGTATTAQSQSLSATGFVTGCTTTQAAQTLTASGSVIIHVRDSQDFTLGIVQRTGALRDSQDLALAALQNPGNVRDSQDYTLVLAYSLATGTISTDQTQTLSASGVQLGCFTDQASQAADASGTTFFPNTRSGADKPLLQLHPVVKPLDFLSRPLTQAGKPSATFTTLLTEGGASRAFSMPLGARNQPIAGKVFSFTMGGTLTPGNADGTLTIIPLYGATADGVNLGQSSPQNYSASTSPIPWRLKAEIIFLSVDFTSGASLVICTGHFTMNGATVLFGGTDPIQVDASSLAANASGAVNFAVSFAPSTLNSQQPVISTKYAFLR